MRALPTGDAGDAVQRLQDEQWHNLDLLDTHARFQGDPLPRVGEAARLASLICTPLRVRSELEKMLLHPALALAADTDAAVARADARRLAMLDALERAEAVSPRDPAHALKWRHWPTMPAPGFGSTNWRHSRWCGAAVSIWRRWTARWPRMRRAAHVASACRPFAGNRVHRRSPSHTTGFTDVAMRNCRKACRT